MASFYGFTLRPWGLVGLLGVVVASGPVASAAVLTFEVDGIGNGNLLPQEYGDRISAATMGSFTYGVDAGLTPNVLVDYASGGQQTPLNWWGSGYNDLFGVVEHEPDGASGYELVFTAEPGILVTLADCH